MRILKFGQKVLVPEEYQEQIRKVALNYDAAQIAFQEAARMIRVNQKLLWAALREVLELDKDDRLYTFNKETMEITGSSRTGDEDLEGNT